MCINEQFPGLLQHSAVTEAVKHNAGGYGTDEGTSLMAPLVKNPPAMQETLD